MTNIDRPNEEIGKRNKEKGTRKREKEQGKRNKEKGTNFMFFYISDVFYCIATISQKSANILT